METFKLPELAFSRAFNLLTVHFPQMLEMYGLLLTYYLFLLDAQKMCDVSRKVWFKR